jgi:hypothetical protein
MKTVADQFTETLAAAGMWRIYGISGHADEAVGLAKTTLRR